MSVARTRALLIHLPAAALGVHAALVAHALFVFGHWPRQYRDPEVFQLGNAWFSAHANAAAVATLGLLPATVALVCVASLYGASRRQLVVFALPFAIWLAAVFGVDRVGVFYGWLWD